MEEWSSLFWTSVVISLFLFPVSLLVAWFLLVRMPSNYLLQNGRSQRPSKQPVVVRLVWILVRNLAGAMLLLTGFVMLFTPGQGLLFMFLGIAFLDFPGKRSLLHRLLCQPKITNPINRLRARSGKAPLQLPGSARPSEMDL